MVTARDTPEGSTYVIRDEGQELLGWRDVPVDNSSLSQDPEIRRKEPVHRQVFIGRSADIADEEAFERKLYIVRKVISARIFAGYSGIKNDFYVVSMSCRTIVYKGMFLAHQLSAYYRDLHDDRFQSGLAMVHQRFSTNTFPSWRLAHPYRFICHNGEINTLRGNVNWMRASRRSLRASSASTCRGAAGRAPGGSDSRPSTTSSSCSCSPGGRCRTR
jgi:glutamate synthase (NADPH/NADH) large chain